MKKPETCAEAAELIGQFLALPNNEWLRRDALGVQNRAQRDILQALGDIPIPPQVAAIFNMDYMLKIVNHAPQTCAELVTKLDAFLGDRPLLINTYTILKGVLSEFGDAPLPPGVIRHLDDRFLEWLKEQK